MSNKIQWLLLLGLVSIKPMALDISGEWIQGGLILGQVDPDHQLEFLGKSVRVADDGHFVIGMGRDTSEEVALLEKTPAGEVINHRFHVKQRQYREQWIEGVPQKTVDVPEESLSRIRKETKLVKVSRRIDSTRQDYRESFVWPLVGTITGVYGSRRFYNGQGRKPHYGIDIAAPKGTKVKAPASGKVTLVHNDMYFSGGTLIIDHGHGVSSTFIHLHKILVQEGDNIEQRQVIAEVGSTGRSTGPHLDWRVNWFNQRLDPQLLVD